MKSWNFQNDELSTELSFCAIFNEDWLSGSSLKLQDLK